MNILFRLGCIAVGYIFGLFQTAFFYGKLKGIDIRKQGSGNAGTTNALRVLGTKAGLIVFVGDVLKCIIAVFIMVAITKNTSVGEPFLDSLYLIKMYTAAGVILGHNFPFYMHFKGGKGIAATAGFCISFNWTFLVSGLAAFFIPFFTTHLVSLGSLLVYAVHMVQIVVMGQIGFFKGMPQERLTEMYILYFLLGVMAYYRHRKNIVSLCKGTERKTYLSKKNQKPKEEV